MRRDFFGSLARAVTRRPTLVLAVVGRARAGRRRPGAAAGARRRAWTRWCPARPTGRKASERFKRDFGDDAVVVLVKGTKGKGDLQRTLLSPDLGRLIKLEGCLSGNVPAKGLKQLPAPCRELAKLKPAKVVYGPGTFINTAVNQITGQLTQRQQATAQQAEQVADVGAQGIGPEGRLEGAPAPAGRGGAQPGAEPVHPADAPAGPALRADGPAGAGQPRLHLHAGVRQQARRRPAQDAAALVAYARSIMPFERLVWRGEVIASNQSATGPAVIAQLLGDARPVPRREAHRQGRRRRLRRAHLRPVGAVAAGSRRRAGSTAFDAGVDGLVERLDGGHTGLRHALRQVPPTTSATGDRASGTSEPTRGRPGPSSRCRWSTGCASSSDDASPAGAAVVAGAARPRLPRRRRWRSSATTRRPGDASAGGRVGPPVRRVARAWRRPTASRCYTRRAWR